MFLAGNRALLDGFRAGRPAELKTVYLHYQPRIAGFLRAGFSFTSGDRHLRFRGYHQPFDVETATQETLSRAFVPAARLAYDGLRPFLEYLFGIARNYVLNELRRHDRLVLVGSAEEIEPAAPPQAVGTPVEPTLEEREVERLLGAFLAGCTAVDRDLYRLRFREELAQEETARQLSLTRIQVRRIELKLKRRLLVHLKQNGYLADVRSDLLGAGLRLVLL